MGQNIFEVMDLVLNMPVAEHDLSQDLTHQVASYLQSSREFASL